MNNIMNTENKNLKNDIMINAKFLDWSKILDQIEYLKVKLGIGDDLKQHKGE